MNSFQFIDAFPVLRGPKLATVSRCALTSAEGDNNFHQSTGSAPLLRRAQDAVGPFCCQGTALADVCCLSDPCVPFQHSCSPQSAPRPVFASFPAAGLHICANSQRFPLAHFSSPPQVLLNGNLVPGSPSLMSSVSLMNAHLVPSSRSLTLNRARPSTDPVPFHLPQASRLSMTH